MGRRKVSLPLLLSLGLLVSLGVGLTLSRGTWRSPPGDGPASEADRTRREAPPAVLQGRPAPADELAMLCGRVARADGGPLGKVQIYLIDKAGEAEAVPSLVTNSRPARRVGPRHGGSHRALGGGDCRGSGPGVPRR